MAVAEPAVPADTPVPRASRTAALLAAVAFAVVFAGFYLNAPGGLLGKADAVGYAVCHRISVRSFLIGNVQMALCARCTGIYLGVVLGIVIMVGLGRWRHGLFPPMRVVVLMVLFITAMGIDGVNSYLKFIPGLPQLYASQNWLRLLTGTLTGIAVSGLIYPVFNQTLWREWRNAPVVGGLLELVSIVLAAVIVVGLVLTNNPLILFPLSLISAGGVVLLMSMTNAVIFMLATRTENQAQDWRGAAVPLLSGAAVSLGVILFIDIVRFAVTGTWGGFVIPGA